MKKIFTDKKIRYGTFSTVISLVFIIFLILINLVIGEFDYKFDMTSDKTYSISEKSREVLDGLDEDITIYTMFKTGNTDSIVTRVQKVLDQYAHYPHIKVENKDLYLYPKFAAQYSTEDKNVNLNSIVVTNGSKFKVIDYSEYFENSGNMNVESCVTSAINYVGLENDPVIYAVTGHGEADHNEFSNFVQQAKLANYQFRTINLLDEDIPADCSVLFITSCDRDYSSDEAEKVKDYLANDGHALFVTSLIGKETHPNLISIINAYGVDIAPEYINESDMSNYIQYPVYVLPKLEQHQITQNLSAKGYRVFAAYSNPISTLDLKKQGLKIEKLLTTGEGSYIKAEGNLSPNPEENDIMGPFTVAAAVTDATYTDTSHETRLVVVGCFPMLIATYDDVVNGGGATFLVDSLNWLNGSEENIYISPKSLASESIVIDNAAANNIKIFAWGVIPGAILLIGFIVCLRRLNG